METITLTFKTGETIPGPGDVFMARKPDAPGGVARVQVLAILGIQWYTNTKKAKTPAGVAVTMVATITIPEQSSQEGGAPS